MPKFLALFLGLMLTVSALAADPQPLRSVPMNDQQVDAALNQIFAGQKKLTHLQAKVTSRKEGGVFAGKSVETWGMAYAQMPDLLLFIDRGEVAKNLPENQANYVLIDGSYLWDVKNSGEPGAYEAERIDLKNAGDRDLNIASLLIGAEVNNSAELRGYYTVSGVFEDLGNLGKSYHFRFKTIPGKAKNNKDEESELWVRPGEIIPWKLKVTSQTKKADVFSGETTVKTSVSEKDFSDVRTNLSQPPLPPFQVVQTFYVGMLLKKYAGTKVTDKGEVVPNDRLYADLRTLLSRLQEKQK